MGMIRRRDDVRFVHSAYIIYTPVFNRAHYTSVITHQNQSFSYQRPSHGKTIMLFVIPEMPSKTFVKKEKGGKWIKDWE